MNTAQFNLSHKFITLKQTSDRLNVPIETLLSWNQHNILKPTITNDGEIVYTQEQVDKFLTIRQLNQATLQPSPRPIEVTTSETSFKQTPLTTSGLDFAHVDLKSEIDAPLKPSRLRLILPVAVLFIALVVVFAEAGGINLLTGQKESLAIQTSKLTIPGQHLSLLPIQLSEETMSKESFDKDNQSAFENKSATSWLFRAKVQKNTAVKNQQQGKILAASASTGGQTKEQMKNIANDYALTTVDFENPCPTCTSSEDSAIDENGNIRGETSETDTLASILGGIDGLTTSDSVKPANNNSTNQLVLLFIGALAALFMLRKQSHHSVKKSVATSSSNQVEVVPQKILEVDQKTDGTVMLYFMGKEYKICKPELYSESDQFIETLMNLVQPGVKEIEYDTSRYQNIRLTTPLSRLVTRLGFVGIKRDLFFPRTSKNGVLFRKYLTQQDLNDMNLTTDQVRELITDDRRQIAEETEVRI